MSDKMTPEIRFKGFSDDWEQRKLGDILKVNSGRDYKHLHSGNIPVYGTGGYMLSVDDKLSQQDGIGIGRKGTIDKPQYLSAPFWTVDTLFYLTPLNNHKLKFIQQITYIINWKKYSEQTGVPSLSKNSIEKIDINVPEITEQTKISELLRTLDSTIALHQQKLDQLSKMKTSLLQDIFPTDGQNRPKIRFTYFYDIWEKRKLSSKIISELKGKARREMIGNGAEYLDTIHLNGGESQKVNSPSNVTKEDIIILWDGSKAGTIYHGFSGALGSTLKSYKIKGSSSFLYQYLKKYQHLIYENYRTPNIPHVNKNFTNEFYIYETKNEEENKIGKLLNNIDAIVDLHQQKIDKLQQIKKAYLQKMFI